MRYAFPVHHACTMLEKETKNMRLNVTGYVFSVTVSPEILSDESNRINELEQRKRASTETFKGLEISCNIL